MAPQGFAGVAAAVYGDTFGVVKGGEGKQAEKTFIVTLATKVVEEGNLKGAKETKAGLMAKVTAAADGNVLVIWLLPAKKGARACVLFFRWRRNFGLR